MKVKILAKLNPRVSNTPPLGISVILKMSPKNETPNAIVNNIPIVFIARQNNYGYLLKYPNQNY